MAHISFPVSRVAIHIQRTFVHHPAIFLAMQMRLRADGWMDGETMHVLCIV